MIWGFTVLPSFGRNVMFENFLAVQQLLNVSKLSAVLPSCFLKKYKLANFKLKRSRKLGNSKNFENNWPLKINC